MKVTTTASKQIWQSPDKQRTIWQINVKDENDQVYGGLKTYDSEISIVGYTGEVETYDRLNNQGSNEKFARKPGSGNKGGGGNNAARLEQDKAKQKEIRAEWAIAKAIQASGSPFPLDEAALNQVQNLAAKFYVMVDTVIQVSGEA